MRYRKALRLRTQAEVDVGHGMHECGVDLFECVGDAGRDEDDVPVEGVAG